MPLPSFPRPCLRLRTLLIAVAVLGVALGIWEMRRRHERFEELARKYDDEASWFDCELPLFLEGTEEYREPPILQRQEQDRVRRAYYAQLSEKYEHAARYPWLTVAPDPPPPE